MENRKKVLVTGSNGYIGSHVVQFLRNKQLDIIASNRHSNDADLYLDFSSPQQVAKTKVEQVDVMVHTASLNERLYHVDKYRALSDHITSIYAALDFCVSNNIPSFIYFSSFHVFGNEQGSLTEQRTPVPASDYGLAHLLAEQAVQLYHRNGRLKGWVIRPSNVYGVPAHIGKFTRWNLIPFQFCKEAIDKGTIMLTSSGEQQRNFVHITDVCRTLYHIINEEPTYYTLHSYGKETISVYEFAQLIGRVALDNYHLKVNVTRPTVSTVTNKFQFYSIYDAVEPSMQIEPFVVQMLAILLKTN